MAALEFVVTSFLSFALGFFTNFSYDKYKRRVESKEFSLSSVLIRSNFFESYFTDEAIQVSCEITNQSVFHWHDIKVDVYSSIFINESPVAWLIDDPVQKPYFKRLSIEIPFLKSKECHSVEIPYLRESTKEIPNQTVVEGISVADGVFNPLLFAPLLNNPETFVKFMVRSDLDDPHFPTCLYETFFKTQMFSVLQNLFGNPDARYGGIIDYLVITGKSRVSRKDIEFLKIVPLANVWLSTKEGPLANTHDLLFVNTCFGMDVDFQVKEKTLHTIDCQTHLKHGKPGIAEIKTQLSKRKLAFDHSVLRIGDDVNNIEFSMASVSSASPCKFKNLATTRFGQEIVSPEIRLNF